MKIELIRPVEDLYIGVGEVMAIKSEQHIPDAFIDENRRDYEASGGDAPIGNWMKVARIPASVVNHWMREGYNIFNMTVTEIQDKLKRDSLDYFLTTKKHA